MLKFLTSWPIRAILQKGGIIQYLAVIKVGLTGIAEKVCKSEKEAHEWAFSLDGAVLERIIPIEDDYAETLLKNAVFLARPEIEDKRN